MHHEIKKYTILLNGDDTIIPMDIIEVRLRLNALKRSDRDKRISQLFIPAMTALMDTIERDLDKKFPNNSDIDHWLASKGYPSIEPVIVPFIDLTPKDDV